LRKKLEKKLKITFKNNVAGQFEAFVYISLSTRLKALPGTNTLAYFVFDEEEQVLMTLTTASTLTATPSAGRATSSRTTNAAPTGIPFQTRGQCYKTF
jgi:hypothetical protein